MKKITIGMPTRLPMKKQGGKPVYKFKSRRRPAYTAPPPQTTRTNMTTETTDQEATQPIAEPVIEEQAAVLPGDDFDFIDEYDESTSINAGTELPENVAPTAINCGFVGFGGGGGKLAKAFLDLGFSRSLLINTTVKDQPTGVDPKNFVLIPGADGVGKDVDLGQEVLDTNSAIIEDVLRTRLGKIDWLFVLAGGGGGTGSACSVLQPTFERYLASVHAEGRVVYIVTAPTAQELLNPTIKENAAALLQAVADKPHIVLDNELQVQLLRGKVGILGLLPKANLTFAKLLGQVLKLASENSPIQTFDTKDLERVLRTNGRIFLGTTVVRNIQDNNLGATIFQGCLKRSPCPAPQGKPKTGVLLLVIDEAAASDAAASAHMEAAISYVGGRTETLFSGVYVRSNLPGLIAITLLGGLS
jgi:cell division GTPase FtsZ